MRWTFYVPQKMKIALSMAFVILLVLATNFLNKLHFNELQDSFNSVYKDRLMAEIYIYDMTMLLNEKKSLSNDSTSISHAIQKPVNDSIQQIIRAYENTFLTQEEGIYFDKLKDVFDKTVRVEKTFATQGDSIDLPLLKGQYREFQLHLSELSEVQRKEGKRLIDESRKIVATSRLTLQLELVILIVIGVIIQILIFSAKPVVPRFKQNANLN